MAGLFKEVGAFLESRSATRALSERFGIEEREVAGAAAVLGVPLLIEAMAQHAGDPASRKVLLAATRSVDATGLSNPQAAIDGGLFEPTGTELVRLVIGDRKVEAAHLISDHMRINARSAYGMLPVAAWAIVAAIAGRLGDEVDGRSLVSLLERTRADLLAGGWGPWMNALGDARRTPMASMAVVGAGVQEGRQTGAGRPTSSSPRGVPEGARVTAYEHPVRPGRARRPTPDRHDSGSPRPRPSTRLAPNRPLAGGVLREVLISVGVMAVVLVLGLTAIDWFTGDDQPQVPIDLPDTDTTVSSGTVTGRTVATVGQEFEAAPAADPAPGGAVVFNVMMDDPLKRSGSTGLAELQFDPDAGQICYTVDADGMGVPYDGHIHVGPAGVKGGIVVDFGPVDNLEAGCVSVAANDMAAILADPGNHYVEMHDPGGGFTIRVQLADDAAAITGAGAITDFDPDGGGAITSISSGRITLVGAVPDQATADELVAEVVGLDESRILVVNDLEVVDGAPLPTGRIIVDEPVLFAPDSDVLDAVDATLMEDLALLFMARPEWTMTVVGHTDDTGVEVYNLELSLRRARAVRDALVGLGIRAESLKVEGAGSTDPVGDNATAEGRAQNRRIEFRVDR